MKIYMLKTHVLMVVVTVLSLAISACGVSASSPYSNGKSNGASSQATAMPTNEPPTSEPAMEPTSAPTGGVIEVQIAGFAFSPAAIITAGTTVTWTNEDSTPHKVVADDGSFISGTLNPGDTFSFTFQNAGIFSYHCGIHASMKGSITVTP